MGDIGILQVVSNDVLELIFEEVSRPALASRQLH